MKSKKFIFFIVFFIFLIFLKSDFRIINDLNCCNDDYDYFAHASTIGEDFDLDYSNQLPSQSRFYRNEKDAPFGFIGTGLLSAPFIFFGNSVDNLFNYNGSAQFSAKYLIYSFSSTFYFLLSIMLLSKIQVFYKIKTNYFLFFIGSGITYYVFERYSMTPIYEVFTILSVIFLTQKFINNPKKRNYYSCLIPFVLLLSILVRWTNLFVFLVPIIVILSFEDYEYGLIKSFFNKYFLGSFVLNFLLFMYFSKQVYGVITFSPSYVYMADEFANELTKDVLGNIWNFSIEFLKDFFVICFSQEFGLFWFSPVIFIATFIVILKVLKFKTLQNLILYFLLLISFLECFLIVSVWNSTASSYGYRYLFSLIPLSFLVIFINNDLIKKNLIFNYLKYFSIFAFISTLFFDATEYTTLSIEPIINSFGYEKIYSQPKYLEGFIKSIFIFEAYQKIIATSFFFIILVEVLIYQLNIQTLSKFLSSFSSNNSDLADLLLKINEISLQYYLIVILVTLIFTKFITNHILKNKGEI